MLANPAPARREKPITLQPNPVVLQCLPLPVRYPLVRIRPPGEAPVRLDGNPMAGYPVYELLHEDGALESVILEMMVLISD